MNRTHRIASKHQLVRAYIEHPTKAALFFGLSLGGAPIAMVRQHHAGLPCKPGIHAAPSPTGKSGDTVAWQEWDICDEHHALHLSVDGHAGAVRHSDIVAIKLTLNSSQSCKGGPLPTSNPPEQATHFGWFPNSRAPETPGHNW